MDLGPSSIVRGILFPYQPGEKNWEVKIEEATKLAIKELASRSTSLNNENPRFPVRNRLFHLPGETLWTKNGAVSRCSS